MSNVQYKRINLHTDDNVMHLVSVLIYVF